MSQKAVYYRQMFKNNGAREHRVSEIQTALPTARQQERHLLDLCLLGACLLVTSVSLIASCKKWTCPPDNHARTFDMSGDILTCLGHTDWHYFEPCIGSANQRCGHRIKQYNVTIRCLSRCNGTLPFITINQCSLSTKNEVLSIN